MKRYTGKHASGDAEAARAAAVLTEASEINDRKRIAWAPLSSVRIYRLIEGQDHWRELRLCDGFIDSLETFWNGDAPALTLLVPDEFAALFRRDLFRTPRVEPEVVGWSEALGWLGEVALAERDPITRRYLIHLAVAARDPAAIALVLDGNVFPIREVSAATLLGHAYPNSIDSEAHGVNKPICFLHGGLAALTISKAEGFDQPILSRRRRLVLDAVADSELAFSIARENNQGAPLIHTVPEARWRQLAAEGWKCQPWKTLDEPIFLHFAGLQSNPEVAMSVVYGAFHR